MTYRLRMALQRGYFEEAGDDKSGGGDADAAAKAAADKAAAQAEADRKAKEEADKKAGEGKPSDKEAELLKEVMEKKNALKAAQQKAAELEAQVKEFEGIDPEKVRALLKQQAEAETAALEAKGEFDKVKKQMVEAHQAELAKREEAVQTLSAQNQSLQSTIAELTVGTAFGQSKFILDEMALTPSKARVVFGGHFEFKDGQVVGYDKPAGKAGRTVLVDGKGDPLSFEDAIRKIVDMDPDKDQLLKAKMKPGAGSNTKSGNGSNVKVERELSAREKIAAGLRARAGEK